MSNKNLDTYTRSLDVALPQQAPPSDGLKLASFFCGCGGMDLGFRSAGFKLAFANDIYAKATESFQVNLGHAPILCDIREIDPTVQMPKVDVITGGFPCVTFSGAGKRMGVEDTVNGMLYMELCRIIKQCRPKYFVAENVKGMILSRGGVDIRLILAAFLRLGYRTTYKLINMAEHGVPQTRERVIFVGIRRDQWRGEFRFPKQTHRLRGDKKARGWLQPALTLGNAIGDLPDFNGIVGMMHGDSAETLKRKSSVSGFSNSKPRSINDTPHSQTTLPNVLIANRDQVSGAKMSSYVNTRRRPDYLVSGMPVIAHASSSQWVNNMRRMSVRECARIQSFPDWFEFKGSVTDGYKQVGNAVPPLYAWRLATALTEYDQRTIR